MPKDIWYLYIIKCRQGTLYTGITTDVNRRLQEHQSDELKGAKYLRGRGPLELVYCCPIGEKSLALQIEYIIKRLPKSHKIKLIQKSILLEHLLVSKLNLLKNEAQNKL